jgi:hypothetical protein
MTYTEDKALPTRPFSKQFFPGVKEKDVRTHHTQVAEQQIDA